MADGSAMFDVARRPFDVYLFGLVPFDEAQALQRRLVYDLGESRAIAALVLCEHPPVISVGRLGSRAHIAVDDDELRERAIGIKWVNRGGGCVLHVPGQLNAYLAISLEAAELNLNAYLVGLHRVLLGVLEDLDVRRGTALPGHPGVFVGGARVGTVGVAVKRWTAYYGMTVNVGQYLEPFHVLDEPGPGRDRLSQTSLEALRQRPAPMSRVRESLISRVESTFDLQRNHLFTTHPMIGRKARSHAHAVC
jgi:lipoyl(octanoyl) transferase